MSQILPARRDTRGQSGQIRAAMTESHSDAGGGQASHRATASYVALAASALLLLWVLLPLWQPLLFAALIAAALANVQERVTARMGGHRHLAALCMTFLVVVLLLTPVTLIGILAVKQSIEVVASLREALNRGGLAELIRPLPDGIERWLTSLLDRLPSQLRGLSRGPAAASQAAGWAALQLQSAITTVSSFAFDLLMMLIALFFLLADGPQLVDWMRRSSPLGRARTQELLDEFRMVSRSLIGSNFITGVAQAVVATIGYYIARAPQPLFFGLLTFLTSFIPSVGTAIVSFPLAGLLFLMGHPWAALFLVLWSVVLVGTVDNLLRPYLMRGDMNVHGALVFFVIIGGLALFSVAGLAVGPIALMLFLTTMRFYQRDIKRGNTVKSGNTSPASR